MAKNSNNPDIKDELIFKSILLDSVIDSIFVYDTDLKLIYVNKAGADLIGAESPKQLIGFPIMQIVHPDYREIVLKRLAKMSQGQEVSLTQQKLIRLDGQIIDVEVSATPIIYNNKPFFQMIIHNIGDRKKANEGLEQSEARYRALFERSPDGIVLMDGKDNIAG